MARKSMRSGRSRTLAVSDALGNRIGAPLSLRQSEILGLIAHGKSNKEIAQQLGLTTGTVKQHVYALFRKLGARNRTMAVARAASLPGAAPLATPSEAPLSNPEPQQFARRLVTAVVVEPRPERVRSVSDAGAADAAIHNLRARLERLAYAFDARSELLAGGGATIWFGQPYAHGDDAERAIAFVRALERLSGAVPCAIGVGTEAEVVGDSANGLTAYRTFRLASLLASLAKPGVPLACSLTSEFAGLHDSPASSGAQAAGPRSLPEGTCTVGPPRTPSLAIAQRWGGLPFVGELLANVQRGRCQWLAIESWPPESGTRLLNAIGEFLGARGLPVRELWMPAQSSRGEVARRLVGQLHEGLPASGLIQAPAVLRDALAALAAERPAVLLAHGIEGMDLLKAAIGEVGLQRLRDVRLIVAAGSMHRLGEPQTTVRLLGAHPAASPFVRVLRMQVPAERARTLDGIRPDVQAVLDSVSADARAIARVASDPGTRDVPSVARALGLAQEAVIARCREFENSGFISVIQGRLEFRDATTAAAVRASLV